MQLCNNNGKFNTTAVYKTVCIIILFYTLCGSPAFDEWSHHTLHPDYIDLLFLPLTLPPLPLFPPSHPSPDVGLPFISRQADNAIVEAASRALVFATASPPRQSFAQAKFWSDKVSARQSLGRAKTWMDKVLSGHRYDREKLRSVKVMAGVISWPAMSWLGKSWPGIVLAGHSLCWHSLGCAKFWLGKVLARQSYGRAKFWLEILAGKRLGWAKSLLGKVLAGQSRGGRMFWPDKVLAPQGFYWSKSW